MNDNEPAPWDIGRPQPEVVRLLEADQFHGPVLDVGCGTGENAILLAMAGYDVTAIDIDAHAIEQARAEAMMRDVEVQWLIGDALELPRPVAGQRFGTVLDAALFQGFSAAQRVRYAEGLAQVTRPAGWLHVIALGEETGAPPPGLEDAFGDGWTPAGIEPARYHVRGRPDGAVAWRGTWRRHGIST